jgi:hypothetical protein
MTGCTPGDEGRNRTDIEQGCNLRPYQLATSSQSGLRTAMSLRRTGEQSWLTGTIRFRYQYQWQRLPKETSNVRWAWPSLCVDDTNPVHTRHSTRRQTTCVRQTFSLASMRRQIVDLSRVELAKVACKASPYPDTQALTGDVLTTRRCTPSRNAAGFEPAFPPGAP